MLTNSAAYLFIVCNFAKDMEKKILTHRAEESLGINKLTDMQQRMLSLAHSGDNIVVTAPTGSGKTLGFSLNVLAAMHVPDGKLQTVVIVPSRELALQVGDVMRRLTSGVYKLVVCYGGHPFVEEERSLAAGADIVVATPGRLLDHINRRTIDVKSTDYLVLDEYDKSLELGFADEMKRIVRVMQCLKRVVMTSATRIEAWPEWLPQRKTTDITVEQPHSEDEFAPVEVIEVTSFERDKLPVLNDLLRSAGDKRSIIFVNHRDSVERVAAFLRKLHYPVGVYHGGMEQIDRENALEMFTNGSTPVLVSTDLGARGLDITDVDNVIHYHLPTSQQAWTHRNGRTGRMGGTRGSVYAIVAEGETIPEYMQFARSWCPPEAPDTYPEQSHISTLWFGAGKKDKLSKGDIVGFLTKTAGLNADEIGRITLRDHNALVAVDKDKAGLAVEASKESRVKGKKIKVTRLG